MARFTPFFYEKSTPTARRRRKRPPSTADPRGSGGRQQKNIINGVYIPPAALPEPVASRYGEISPLFLCKIDSWRPPSPRAAAESCRPPREMWQAAKEYHKPQSRTKIRAPGACNTRFCEILPCVGSCHVIRAPVGKQWLYGGEIDRNDEYDDVEQEGLSRHSGRDSGSRYTATNAGSAFADTL